LLRHPEPGERPPSRILIADATAGSSPVERAWLAYTADPEAEPGPAGRAVRIIDLLDDEVDLSPARHRQQHDGVDLGAAFLQARDRFTEVSAALTTRLPVVDVLAGDGDLPMTTIGDLVKAGLVSVHHAAVKMRTAEGELPVLTAEDVAVGGPPSGRTTAEPGLIKIEPLDVVTTNITETGIARVLSAGGAVLGPQLSLYRADPDRIDPHFLAGFLRFAGGATAPRGHFGVSRADGRRARIPLLPIAEQRAYGRVFLELITLEDTLRETARLGDTLVRLGFDGLAAGLLRPRSEKV
ncbi:MAG TPA: SAM-dependent methyltransferase, partial [Thermopolyspora sp.]